MRVVFAEEISSLVGKTFAAVGTLATVAAGAYALYTRARSRARLGEIEARKQEVVVKGDEIDAWRDIAHLHEENAARQEKIVEGLRTVLELEQRHHVRCQRSWEQQRSALYFVKDFANRLHGQLADVIGKDKAGQPLELPKLDELPIDTGGVDFLARQVEQASQEVREGSRVIALKKADLEKASANTPAGEPADQPPARP